MCPVKSLLGGLLLYRSDLKSLCERPENSVLSKKRFLGAFSRHLSFWVSGVKLPLIFYTKK